MSERDVDVIELIDRAVQEAPALSLSPANVVAGGRGKVRRRRLTAVGSAVGAMAVAGAVWLGSQHGAGLDEGQALTPAASGSVAGAGQETAAPEVDWLPDHALTLASAPHSGGNGAVRDVQLEPGSTPDDSVISLTMDGVRERLSATTRFGGRVMEYRSPRVTVLLYPAADVGAIEIVSDAHGESSDFVDVGDTRLYWTVLERAEGPVTVRDIVFVDAVNLHLTSASGAPASRATLPSTGPGAVVWSIPDSDYWTVWSDTFSASGPMSERLLVSADDSRWTWIGRVPADAVEARLTTKGQPPRSVATDTDLTTLGTEKVATFTTPPHDDPLAEQLYLALQWRDAEGTWHDADE